MNKTIFIDIDGTIFEHQKNLHKMITGKQNLIVGTVDKFLEWRKKGYYIVITTARPEGTRKVTEQQLMNAGLFYDQLVMGLPTGPRVVINDEKPDKTQTAFGVCIKRNSGIKDIKI